MTLYTSKVVAEWLGITERRVRQLRDEGVITEARPGLYDLQGTVIRYITYLRRGSNDLNDERARLTRAKREAVERENAIKQGELCNITELEQGLKTMCLNVKGRLLGIPAKLAPTLTAMEKDQQKIFDLLTDNIREALEDMSDYRLLLKEITVEGDGGE